MRRAGSTFVGWESPGLNCQTAIRSAVKINRDVGRCGCEDGCIMKPILRTPNVGLVAERMMRDT